MSLKQGFILGIGALGGGALGFYIQGVLMEKYRTKTESFIDSEVARRLQEEKSTSTNNTRNTANPRDRTST